MNLFIKLFSAYTISIIFFMGLLPRIIVNSLNSETTENPFKYSHVLINN